MLRAGARMALGKEARHTGITTDCILNSPRHILNSPRHDCALHCLRHGCLCFSSNVLPRLIFGAKTSPSLAPSSSSHSASPGSWASSFASFLLVSGACTSAPLASPPSASPFCSPPFFRFFPRGMVTGRRGAGGSLSCR
jgi:hypothetical protein